MTVTNERQGRHPHRVFYRCVTANSALDGRPVRAQSLSRFCLSGLFREPFDLLSKAAEFLILTNKAWNSTALQVF
jgi:hypothetical protein